ncbi:putative ABC transporter, ATP-binding protein [Desulfonema limicola]|uniref:ABC transporter, ATP-binding protein n=1 Tax=Desulfonema limicola TaxID=45656 RepID=A0A975GH43_9BACT|nr:ABC transporter ATP-binding protein [Desulfonema limicola]QTA81015.1 putative ABC transporter, ATP-binding protein [Desulfonema limicola]
MNILEVRQLTKTYTIENRQITILDNITFAVPAGSFMVIEGASGSGKSTLLTLLSGLDQPDSGTVLIQDTDITFMNEDELAPMRNKTLGFVFQSFHLVPSLTSLENVMFPAELKKDPQAEEKAELLLKKVGLGKRRFNYPHQLSGGEKQRVAICRAMINDPALIFADEPTGNLDSENSSAILDLLLDLRRERGSTLILVTHSTAIAAMADKKITLKDGRIAGSKNRGD